MYYVIIFNTYHYYQSLSEECSDIIGKVIGFKDAVKKCKYSWSLSLCEIESLIVVLVVQVMHISRVSFL